jgi:hypothetical protein
MRMFPQAADFVRGTGLKQYRDIAARVAAMIATMKSTPVHARALVFMTGYHQDASVHRSAVGNVHRFSLVGAEVPVELIACYSSDPIAPRDKCSAIPNHLPQQQLQVGAYAWFSGCCSVEASLP